MAHVLINIARVPASQGTPRVLRRAWRLNDQGRPILDWRLLSAGPGELR